jgi:hypothetical protein
MAATVQRTLIVKSTDALGKTFEKSMTHANPNATAANIDTFAKAIVGLSTNTYGDTIIRDETSVNEALAE